MLRALVVLLLLANLLFFAWARGWLAPALPPPHQGEREPERLTRQIRPGSVQLLTPQAASAAAAVAAPACIEAGPFGDAEAGSAEAALTAAGVPAAAWARKVVQPPASWLVYMGRFADPATLRTKQDELRRLKISFEDVQAPPELAPGLALSRHDSREAANAALALLAQRGVHTARVVAQQAPARVWLRAAQADGALRTRLQALPLARPFTPCADRP